jgi:hypothetical protein
VEGDKDKVEERERRKTRRGGGKGKKIIGKKIENRKGKKEMREVYYRYFTLLSMRHSQMKLFC